MSIPSYRDLFTPVLKQLQDGSARSVRDVADGIAKELQLSEKDLQEMIPSGQSTLFANRVGWSRTYLKQAGLLELPRRGWVKITSRGLDALKQVNPLDLDYLRQFSEFQNFVERSQTGQMQDNVPIQASSPLSAQSESGTPEEELLKAYKQINAKLEGDLLDRVRSAPPEFLEKLIVDLLVAMNYGGGRVLAAKALRTRGDGGVDGVIDQDVLGLEQVYIQAKRYKEGSNIDVGTVREFAGAIDAKRAQKGLLVTASDFTSDAVEAAKSSRFRIVLVNGKQLAALMRRHGIGVRLEEALPLNKVDEDFFDNTID